ncbi:MAG: hypothetical protein H7A35_13590 [Planctomycetales bacterium]|nr:hypothetical protein [bacterium]UNM07875.1 MAG: hypothetical protein H7A35_13590 [Planctomycetales bacterium]
MHQTIRCFALICVSALLLMLCGCPPPSNGDGTDKNANAGNGKQQGAGANGAGQEAVDQDMSAFYDGDNLNFQRTNVGLNGKALDLITDDAPLCGAKTGSVFFFGDSAQETGLYRRDLVSGKREMLTSVKDMDKGSLNCSNDGRFISYAKLRDINVVIDNPEFDYPPYVAELYRYDTQSGEETKLFSFGSEFKDYRNDSLYPFISQDGNRIVCLSYDINRLLLQTQCMEWVRLYRELYEDGPDRSPEDRASDDDNMRVFLRADHIAPKLRDMGFEPSAETPIDAAARQAVLDLFERYKDPIMVLLIWEDGKARTQVLTPVAGQERSLHFILAVSEDRILMGAKDPSEDPTAAQQIYSVDIASGQLSPFGTYQGAPSLIEFDGSGQNLVVVYNPFDRQNKRIDTETFIRMLPVDGSAPTDKSLGADYFGFLDLNGDASLMVGQNRDDLWLYRVDTATGEATKISQHFIDVDGLYLDGPGQHAVFIENGISFVTNILADPQSSPDWVSESHFSDYREKVLSFLDTAGFDVKDDAVLRFEERTGMGVSETSIELSYASDPQATVLFRYDNNDKTFSSMWSPNPEVLNMKSEFRKSGMDYYECEDLVAGMLDRLGWQNPETREAWYPGASPLYDGKSDSYIVTFRDGYWYDPAEQTHWVYNSEATVRVIASTGHIAEINYRAFEQISDQPIQDNIADADFNIRNYRNEPIPEGAVEFDYENTRLLITEKKPELVSPGDYRSQVEDRIVYEVNAYLEGELVLGSLVDAETFEVLGRLYYAPQGMRNPNQPLPGGGEAAPAPAETAGP